MDNSKHLRKLIEMWSIDMRKGEKSNINRQIREYSEKVLAELDDLKAEREKVASGKTECADCGSILARF
jgi:hypothetical protein